MFRADVKVILSCGRLWYVACLGVEVAMDSDRQAVMSSPVEIGCVNVIPKCNEWTGKHPVYENLPETYAAINNYLAETPLEGIGLHVNQSANQTHVQQTCIYRTIIKNFYELIYVATVVCVVKWEFIFLNNLAKLYRNTKSCLFRVSSIQCAIDNINCNPLFPCSGHFNCSLSVLVIKIMRMRMMMMMMMIEA